MNDDELYELAKERIANDNGKRYSQEEIMEEFEIDEDDDFYEELEEILIMGDIGVRATNDINERLKEQLKQQHIKEPAQCKQLLIDSIKEQMQVGETAYEFEHQQSVVLVIGVNGVGKTTSVGKLAGKLKEQGRKVMLAAADTFRAAAVEQLEEWAHRAGVDIIAGAENADPASVIFDAVHAAKARKVDVLLCDTAGRLHNKKNLMEELKKINRIIDKEFPDAHRENLVVLDGTTGQNALSQAREFGDEDGWHGKGWYRCSDTVGAEDPGKIYRRGRNDRGSAEIRCRPVCRCTF